MELNRKSAIIIVGPPGSGKDTQAELLAHELKLQEIKSSSIIKRKFAEADPNDPIINREKELNNSGQLNSSELVSLWLKEEIVRVAKEAQGIVLTGGLRREVEAEDTMATISQYYALEDIKIISINISADASLFRNKQRRVCELNRHPIPSLTENKHLAFCPIDGSPIISREDDAPETIKKRYQVYLAETEPILDFLIKKGYNLITINGEQSIEEVHRDILNKLL